MLEAYGSVCELLAVGCADRVQRLLAALSLRRPLEHLERLAEAAGDDGHEELLLRPEEPEHVGLRDAGAAGDVLGRGSVEAALGELRVRRVEDLLAARVLRLAFGRNDHAG